MLLNMTMDWILKKYEIALPRAISRISNRAGPGFRRFRTSAILFHSQNFNYAPLPGALQNAREIRRLERITFVFFQASFRKIITSEDLSTRSDEDCHKFKVGFFWLGYGISHSHSSFEVLGIHL